MGREKKGDTDSMPDVTRLNVASGPNVDFILLENRNTVTGKLFGRKNIARQITDAVSTHDAVILRGITENGIMAYHAARKMGNPVAVEVVGCAFDDMWNYGNIAGKIYAPIKFFTARKIIRDADFVLYVTHDFLQRRYPTRATVTEIASNVEIPSPDPAVLAKRLQKITSMEKDEPVTLGMIGALNNRLKGHHIIFRTMHDLCAQDFNVRLRLLGGGNRAQWNKMVADLGIGDRVFFDGTLPSGNAVLRWLDGIDIYVQPSFQEGLPRAMIEAMSRGCPAIGSTAGGIYELLDPRWIFQKGDSTALSTRLGDMLQHRDIWTTVAGKNFTMAGAFAASELKPRREKFWRAFADYTRNQKH